MHLHSTAVSIGSGQQSQQEKTRCSDGRTKPSSLSHRLCEQWCCLWFGRCRCWCRYRHKVTPIRKGRPKMKMKLCSAFEHGPVPVLFKLELANSSNAFAFSYALVLRIASTALVQIFPHGTRLYFYSKNDHRYVCGLHRSIYLVLDVSAKSICDSDFFPNQRKLQHDIASNSHNSYSGC